MLALWRIGGDWSVAQAALLRWTTGRRNKGGAWQARVHVWVSEHRWFRDVRVEKALRAKRHITLTACRQDHHASLCRSAVSFVLRINGFATATRYMDVLGYTGLLARPVLLSSVSTSTAWCFRVTTVHGRGCGWQN